MSLISTYEISNKRMILTSILHAEVSVEFSVIYEEQSVCDSTCVPGVEFAD